MQNEQIDEPIGIESETRVDPLSTSRSKTNLELRQMGISPKSLPKPIFKKIVVSNSVMEELKEGKAKNNSEYGKKVIRNQAFGNFTKKIPSEQLREKISWNQTNKVSV